jgi:hypothetical protein
MKTTLFGHLSLIALTLAVTACGGGGSTASTPPPPDDTKVAAAIQTVQQNANCMALTPFYWEIGNATTKLAGGTGGSSASGAPAETDLILIASSSKWLYSSFVVEKLRSSGASVSPTADVPFLQFTSGYTNFGFPACPDSGGTIDQCLSALNGIGGLTGIPKGTLSSENVGKFHYDSGHMEKHASNSGFGSYTGATLGTAVSQQLGITVNYADAQPAGSGQTSAAEYAKFLRKVLSGSLGIRALLGTNAVCTWHDAYSEACSAVNSPTDGKGLHWHYSLGHWVEDDDPSNVAYSSAGAFGFYPWVSADLTLYGIIAREDIGSGGHQGFQSAQCGRLVRLAYKTGVAR